MHINPLDMRYMLTHQKRDADLALQALLEEAVVHHRATLALVALHAETVWFI